MTIDNIPEVLKTGLSWAPIGPDKIAKHPFEENRKAKVNDATHWADFPTVRAMINGAPTIAGRLNGEVVVIDLDGTEDLPPDSLVKLKHHEVLKQAYEAGHYIEHSQSGKGYHIVFQGTLPFAGRKSAAHKVEIYTADRYFAFTGNIPTWGNGDYPADVKPDETGTVLELVEFFEARPFEMADVEWKTDPRSVDLIIKSMLSGSGNPAGRDAWQKGYPSNCDRSQVDAQIVEMVVHATHDFEKSREIFKKGAQWTPDREIEKERGRRSKSYVDLTIERIGSQVLARHYAKVQQAQVAVETIQQNPPQTATVTNYDLQPPEEGLLKTVYTHSLYKPYRHFPQAALISALGHLSGMFGPFYSSPTGLGLNLYCLIVAKSGWGKEGPITTVRDVLDQLEKFPAMAKILNGDFGSPQELRSQLAEHGCLILWYHEFGKQIRAALTKGGNPFQAGIFDFMTRLFTLSEDGKKLGPYSVRDKEKNVPDIYQPIMSFVGESTPSDFDGLDPRSFKDGTTSRFLYAVATTRPIRNSREARSMDYGAKAQLEHVAEYLMSQRPLLDGNQSHTRKKVGSTAAAWQWWDQFEDETERRQDDLNDVVLEAVLARSGELIQKVASVVAISRDHRNPIVDVSDYQYAYKIVETSFQNVRNMIGEGIIDDPTEQRRIEAVKHIVGRWYNDELPARHKDKKWGAYPYLVPMRVFNQYCNNKPKLFPSGQLERTLDLMVKMEYLQKYEQIKGHPTIPDEPDAGSGKVFRIGPAFNLD
ncbi:DUF3987 domain-containing protein [Ruegeria sp. Alg231-54]|uniref:DUF3987 domain-containing protein n=1 Tax=Ruegeria sp. Alg231-54 TaxID=1922221 RepID=UPI000D55E792|nr:DUF3987 domain-containing protein [Ruegeria sp. Alg231-54]